MADLFAIRGALGPRVSTALGAAGILLLIALWWGTAAMGWASPQVLPSPMAVLGSVPELHYDDAMARNLMYSVYLNGLGYGEAVLVSLPLGFLIGMFPLFRGLFSKPVDSVRFVPLTAATGLFIQWFGIDDLMKVQFLAVGIIVYLLPVVVQRVREVPEVYQQTAFTLGASRWQMFRTVFLPNVLGRLIDDVRVLVAISWTYIIVAEMMNNTGGIGGLLYTAGIRQGRTDKVFALLFVIVAVGYVQDKLFQWLDKVLFPYKST